MKKKLCIAPFTKTDYPLLTCEPLDYDISSVIAPHGAVISGNDVSLLRNRERIGLCGASDIPKGIDNCDVVLITDVGQLAGADDNVGSARRSAALKTYATLVLNEAIARGKDILCFASMNHANHEKYSHICQSSGIRLAYYEKTQISALKATKIKKIVAPIVFIGETNHDCDGYEIFLKLLHSFSADKKRVLAISENKYNALYNQQSVDFWNSADPMQNILNVNNYVAELANNVKPDVILIKAPEPMTKFNEDITFDFGLTAFVLSQALQVSYMVYCTMLSLCNPQMMSNLSESFMGKFGYSISAIHISNQITDFAEDSKDSMQVCFIENNGTMDEIRKETDVPFYNLNNPEDYKLFYKTLYNELFNFSYGVIAL